MKIDIHKAGGGPVSAPNGTENPKEMTVGVISDDAALVRKIALALYSEADIVSLSTDDPTDSCDTVLLDARNGAISESLGSAARQIYITLRGGTAGKDILPYPFSFNELREVIFRMGTDGTKKRLSLLSDGRHVQLDGKEIRLTESEYRLLHAIVAGDGEFVSRESLAPVFGGSCDKSILNVYVHYLREKLERNGEKIIISSRKGGYKIDKRYLGGE